MQPSAPRLPARERILTQAKDLFRARGYHNTSPDQVMAAADVSKSTFYYHFRGKAELAHAVIAAHERDYWTERLEPTIGDRARPAGERVRLWFERAAAALEARDCRGGCPFAILGLELANDSEPVRQQVHAILQAWREPLATCVADGIAAGEFRSDLPPETLADLLIAQYEGALILAVTGKSGEPLRLAADLLPRLLAAPGT